MLIERVSKRATAYERRGRKAIDLRTGAVFRVYGLKGRRKPDRRWPSSTIFNRPTRRWSLASARACSPVAEARASAARASTQRGDRPAPPGLSTVYAMRTTRFALVRLALVALSSTVLVSLPAAPRPPSAGAASGIRPTSLPRTSASSHPRSRDGRPREQGIHGRVPRGRRGGVQRPRRDERNRCRCPDEHRACRRALRARVQRGQHARLRESRRGARLEGIGGPRDFVAGARLLGPACDHGIVRACRQPRAVARQLATAWPTIRR